MKLKEITEFKNKRLSVEMRNTVLIFIILFSCLTNSSAQNPEKYHKHDGLSLSLGIGSIFGDVKMSNKTIFTEKYVLYDRSTFSSAGLLVDLKVGLAVFQNVIVSFDFVNGSNFHIKEDYEKYRKIVDNKNITESLIGVGLTYYYPAWNVFISGTIGESRYRFTNLSNNEKYSTTHGMGYMFKIGKEWWVSGDLGIGFALAMIGTNADSDYWDVNSNRFSIMFNATFN